MSKDINFTGQQYIKILKRGLCGYSHPLKLALQDRSISVSQVTVSVGKIIKIFEIIDID